MAKSVRRVLRSYLELFSIANISFEEDYATNAVIMNQRLDLRARRVAVETHSKKLGRISICSTLHGEEGDYLANFLS